MTGDTYLLPQTLSTPLSSQRKVQNYRCLEKAKIPTQPLYNGLLTASP
jgi:hypothetical protein